MQSKAVFLVFGFLIMFVSMSMAWPILKTEPVNPDMMIKIPQWHCLRYFKHDIHMMRRCRMHRGPLVGRKINP